MCLRQEATGQRPDREQAGQAAVQLCQLAQAKFGTGTAFYQKHLDQRV